MTWRTDPFRHHPELRDLITDPDKSFFRSFEPSEFDSHAREIGLPDDWRYTDDVRNALLAETLGRLGKRDIWVFAYGSLMWDPGFHFTEVRHAFVAGYARRFILYDTGGRGTPDRPAVMAALDTGDGCDGLVFRIAGARLAEELEILWKREMIAPAYADVTVCAETAQGRVAALAFAADHETRDIRPDLSREDQIESLAFATGALGTNLEYIVNLKTHFDMMGIEDRDIDHLHDAAVARAKNTEQTA